MSRLFILRKFFFSKPKLNKIIVLLTLSDIFAWGLHLVITSIVGIYLAERLGEGAVQIVGIGIAICMASRGLLELPIGKFVDSWDSDTDEILILTVGNILMGASYLFYPLIESPDLYYALQFVFAVGSAMNLIAWKKLFAQNLDKNAEGVEYGEYGMVMGISTAIFSIVAGTIANIGMNYFNLVIISIGSITILSSLFSILIFKVKDRQSKVGTTIQKEMV